MNNIDKKSKLDYNYKIFNIINNKNLGSAKIINYSTDKLTLILINKFKLSEHECFNYNKLLDKLIYANSDYVIKYYDYSIKIESSLCSKTYLYNIYIENLPISLRNELNNRLQNKSCFNNEEITNLMYQQIIANFYLVNNGIINIDIRPENIYIYKSGISKCYLSTDAIEKNIKDFQYINVIDSNSNIYISPMLFNSYLKNKTEKFNNIKETVFCLGMVIMEAALNVNLNKIYDKINKKFNEDLFYFFLNKFEDLMVNKYQNKIVYTTVLNMLNFDESMRPDFSDLISNLPNYDDIQRYFKINSENNSSNNNISISNKPIIVDNNFMCNNSQYSNNENSMINNEILDNSKINNNTNLDEIANYSNNEEKSLTIKCNNNKSNNITANYELPFKVYENEPIPFEDCTINNIEYQWDYEFERHFYFNNLTNTLDWYYYIEERKHIPNNN